MNAEHLRRQRLALVQQLNLKQHYQRTHTSTGVMRRFDHPEIEAKKRNVNSSSLANLARGRRLAS